MRTVLSMEPETTASRETSMNPHHRLIAGSMFLALAAVAHAQSHATVFRGDPATGGDVLVLDLAVPGNAQTPLALQGVRLLDLDVSGRTQFERFLGGKAILRDDIAGASRIESPCDQGSIYHYARGDDFGFFAVAADGSPHVLLERNTPVAGLDPFVATIAVAPAGDAFLIATQLFAGGDLFEVELSGAFQNRTSAILAQQFSGDGLALSSSWGIAVSAGCALRFARGTSGDANAVPFATAQDPVWFQGGVVLSRNGQFACFLAGGQVSDAYPFIVSPAGLALRASDAATWVAGVGFLPFNEGGPWLAVSDDAALVAWKTVDPYLDHYTSKEVQLARVSPLGVQAAVHLTQNAWFESYIDEVGQFAFSPAGDFVFSAGDPAGAGLGALTRMDVFQASLPAGTALPSLRNLSLSSGESTPPFLTYPQLDPQRSVLMPSGVVLIDDLALGEHRLLEVRMNHDGAEELQDELGSVGLWEQTGDELILVLDSVEEPEDRGIHGLSNSLSSSPEMLAQLSASSQIKSHATSSGGHFAFVSSDPTGDQLWRVAVPSGDAERFGQGRGSFTGALALHSDGAVLVAQRTPRGITRILFWRADGSSSIQWATAQAACVLP